MDYATGDLYEVFGLNSRLPTDHIRAILLKLFMSYEGDSSPHAERMRELICEADVTIGKNKRPPAYDTNKLTSPPITKMEHVARQIRNILELISHDHSIPNQPFAGEARVSRYIENVLHLMSHNHSRPTADRPVRPPHGFAGMIANILILYNPQFLFAVCGRSVVAVLQQSLPAGSEANSIGASDKRGGKPTLGHTLIMPGLSPAAWRSASLNELTS